MIAYSSLPLRRLSTGAWLVLGCALRLAGLTVHSLWFDETMSVWIAANPDITDVLSRDRSPPLAFWLLSAWLSVFGVGELAARSCGAIVSCLTLAAFAVGTRSALPPRSHQLAVAIFAVSPFSVWYGQEVRTYHLVELGAVLWWVAACRLRGAPVRAGGWLAVMAIGAAVATGAHYTGAYCALGAGVVAAALAARRQWRLGALVAAATAGGSAAWTWWVVGYLPAQMAMAWGYPKAPGWRDLVEAPFRLLLVAADGMPPAVLAVACGAAALAGLGMARAALLAPGRGGVAVMALAVVFAVLLGSFLASRSWRPAFGGRYAIACEAPLVVLVAIGLTELRVARLAAWSLVLALAAVTVWHKTDDRKEGYRAACALLAQNWRPGDRIASVTGTFDGFSEAPLFAYLHGTEAFQAVVPESRLCEPAGWRRVHVLYREAFYAWPVRDRLLAAFTVVRQEALVQRVQYLCLERKD
ncbi:MAG: glycosyltransferase family 39 protein [Planctomycetota bacterium]